MATRSRSRRSSQQARRQHSPTAAVARESAVAEPTGDTAVADALLTAADEAALPELVGHLAAPQRQQVVARVGERHGNRHAQRVVATLQRADLQRHSAVPVEEEPGAIQRLAAIQRSFLIDDLGTALNARPVDEADVLAKIAAAPAYERTAVLEDSSMVGKIKRKLSAGGCFNALRGLGATLSVLADYAAGKSGVPAADIQTAITGAPAPEQLELMQNQRLLGKLVHRLGATEGATALGALGAPLDVSLTILMGERSASSALVAVITAAPAEQKLTVLQSPGTIAQLVRKLDAADIIPALTGLGAALAVTLTHAVAARGVPAADILAAIDAAPADQKAEALQDARLLGQLEKRLPAADAVSALQKLGATLATVLPVALAGRGIANADILAMIRTAPADQRQEVSRSAGLIGKLKKKLTPMEHWTALLMLEHGPEAGFPGPVTTIYTALQGSPTVDQIKTAIASLSDADFAIVRALPGIRDVLKSLVPNRKDFDLIMRMITEGLLAREAGNAGAVNETLQTGPTTAPFVPRAFAGQRGFDVEAFRDHVQVTVRIKLNPKSAKARRDQSGVETTWKPVIEGVWDNKFSLQNANHTMPIRVRALFTSSSPHHTVDLHSGPATWPGYNQTNWYYEATNYAAHAPAHEVGHMLGSADEYMLSATDYQATVGTAAATDPNATSETDSAGTSRYQNTVSIMGAGTTADKRHMTYFLNWMNTNRVAAEPAFTLV